MLHKELQDTSKDNEKKLLALIEEIFPEDSNLDKMMNVQLSLIWNM